MNAHFPNDPANFGDWTEDMYQRGHIRVIGDEENGFDLLPTKECLDAAYHWLSSRYDPKKGDQCLDFLNEDFLDDMEDGYAAKLLVHIISETDATGALNTARELRHHYAKRCIERFKDRLVTLEMEGPDPMTIHKDQLESDMSNTRAA